LRRLSDREYADHAASLASDGYVIVPDLLEGGEADAIAAAMAPLQDATNFGSNEFVGLRTRRVFNLFRKTRALDDLILHPDVLQLIRSALGPSIQLSIASTMEIFPGETAQALHQDDAFFRIQKPHDALVLNTMWALTDFTEANGATRLVPGSQRRPDAVNRDEPSVAAVMSRGSVLLWDGAVWHGGGANTADDVRFGLSLNFSRGWLRQQENHYLSLDRALVASMPIELQKILGYDICEFLGWADGVHPLRVVNPDLEWSPPPRAT
jgi:hypothetical protein